MSKYKNVTITVKKLSKTKRQQICIKNCIKNLTKYKNGFKIRQKGISKCFKIVTKHHIYHIFVGKIEHLGKHIALNCSIIVKKLTFCYIFNTFLLSKGNIFNKVVNLCSGKPGLPVKIVLPLVLVKKTFTGKKI